MSSQLHKVLSDYPAINDLLENIVEEVRSFSEEQITHIHEMVKIGLALSAEKDLDHLLELIVGEARRFTNADGGTLYIRKEESNDLAFGVVQNDTLNIRKGGAGETISWSPVHIYLKDGSENHSNVSAHCALVKKAVNISDVYDAEGFDFQGTRDFDSTTGYRSKSMLVIPMCDHEDEVIGVLQLLNARDRKSGKVIRFPNREINIITSLASQAAIALTNIRLIRSLENLLYSFIKSIAAAIDEKSPYTGGHITRVAQLTESIADKMNLADKGSFGSTHFSRDELDELSIAAWMHDVGKITTPEYVVDKGTKLETIYDRIELIRHRVEIMKRDAEISRLRALLAANNIKDETETAGSEFEKELDDALSFIESINHGSEFVSDKMVDRISELATMEYVLDGKTHPLLDDNEVDNLSIRKGTLTEDERTVINNHVVATTHMLNRLPFPKKLRNVLTYASMHHEKLDGSGYPLGLTADDLPLQARILAVADVFEALTAADRPYKKGKKMSESMRILGFMVKDNHLDGDICDFIVESGIAAEYAAATLSAKQQDSFEWKGKVYG